MNSDNKINEIYTHMFENLKCIMLSSCSHIGMPVKKKKKKKKKVPDMESYDRAIARFLGYFMPK